MIVMTLFRVLMIIMTLFKVLMIVMTLFKVLVIAMALFKVSMIVMTSFKVLMTVLTLMTVLMICDAGSPDVEVMCWSSEGVDAVKEALKAGQSSASARLSVHVSYLFSYVLSLWALSFHSLHST